MTVAWIHLIIINKYNKNKIYTLTIVYTFSLCVHSIPSPPSQIIYQPHLSSPTNQTLRDDYQATTYYLTAGILTTWLLTARLPCAHLDSLTMTVSSVQTLLPTRFSLNVAENKSAKPPPQVYNVQDNRFRGVQLAKPEGYQRSKKDPANSAIVIDNGSSPHHSSISYPRL